MLCFFALILAKERLYRAMNYDLYTVKMLFHYLRVTNGFHKCIEINRICTFKKLIIVLDTQKQLVKKIRLHWIFALE